MDTKNLEDACNAFIKLSTRAPETGKLIKADRSYSEHFRILEEAVKTLSALDSESLNTLKSKGIINRFITTSDLSDARMMIGHYKSGGNNLLIREYYDMFANICSSMKKIYDSNLMS